MLHDCFVILIMSLHIICVLTAIILELYGVAFLAFIIFPSQGMIGGDKLTGLLANSAEKIYLTLLRRIKGSNVKLIGISGVVSRLYTY